MNEDSAPPHIHAMLAAYVAETGIPVSLSYNRRWALRKLHQLGFTPDDVRAVLRAIAGKIRRGEKGFTDASLSFKNALGDPDVFEERALVLRQKAARLKGAAPRRQVARTDAAGVTRLDDAPLSVPKPADVAQALRGLASEIGGKGS